jgi:hypothetical protein
MVSWREFAIGSVQTAIFASDHSAFVGSRIVAAVMRQFAERFDGEMQALPMPPDVPPNVPRVILQSNDGAWRLIASPARIDCYWTNLREEALNLPQAVAQCADVLMSCIETRPVAAERLALIVQRMRPTEDPAKSLIQRFCNEDSQSEPFNRSANFEIHNHKEYQPSALTYKINSWVRCQCTTIDPQSSRAILVTQDLNTVVAQADPLCFDTSAIRSFFSVAGEEADAIIGKYFPEREGLV